MIVTIQYWCWMDQDDHAGCSVTDIMKCCDVLLGIVDSVLFWWYHHLVQSRSLTAAVLYGRCLHYLWVLYKPPLKLHLGSFTQFYMRPYSKSCRFDRNSKGGGIILYVRQDITSKLINSSCLDHDKEYFLVKLNLRNQKWPIICKYNPNKTIYQNLSVNRLIQIHKSMIIFLC